MPGGSLTLQFCCPGYWPPAPDPDQHFDRITTLGLETPRKLAEAARLRRYDTLRLPSKGARRRLPVFAPRVSEWAATRASPDVRKTPRSIRRAHSSAIASSGPPLPCGADAAAPIRQSFTSQFSSGAANFVFATSFAASHASLPPPRSNYAHANESLNERPKSAQKKSCMVFYTLRNYSPTIQTIFTCALTCRVS